MTGGENIERWDRLASEWSNWLDVHADPAGRAFADAIRHAIVRALPTAPRTRALDLGCGSGELLEELALHYQTAVGFDGSKEMVGLARTRRPEGAHLTFVADATREFPFADGTYDLVVSSMVLMCVDDFSGTIAEVSRVLRDGGEFILTVTHPCFSFMRRHFAAGTHRYVETLSTEHRLGPTFPAVRHYHRPLQDYVAELARHGFVLRALTEISPQDGEDPAAIARLRPYFLTANAILLHAYKGPAPWRT